MSPCLNCSKMYHCNNIGFSSDVGCSDIITEDMLSSKNHLTTNAVCHVAANGQMIPTIMGRQRNEATREVA